MRENSAASRTGIAVDSSRRVPISRPATIQPPEPKTRMLPNSCFGSPIWRKEREFVNAIVGIKQNE